LNKVPSANTNWSGARSSSTSKKPLMIKGFLGLRRVWVQEVDPLIRNPTRIDGILGIKKNWSVDLN